jgi:accessory gene regulator protein AgrB
MGGCSSVVKNLPAMHEALALINSTKKKKKKKKKVILHLCPQAKIV